MAVVTADCVMCLFLSVVGVVLPRIVGLLCGMTLAMNSGHSLGKSGGSGVDGLRILCLKCTCVVLVSFCVLCLNGGGGRGLVGSGLCFVIGSSFIVFVSLSIVAVGIFWCWLLYRYIACRYACVMCGLLIHVGMWYGCLPCVSWLFCSCCSLCCSCWVCTFLCSGCVFGCSW